MHSLVLNPELLRRYDVAGPRYTSYPTADRFVEAFGEADYLQALEQRRDGVGASTMSVVPNICVI
jgi:oxygen-independent coproporphyrinogen-3 oxidase